MINKILFLFLVLIVTGCSQKKEATIEEQVLMKTFASYQAALAFDEHCNKNNPENRYDFEKKENVFLIGNEQMLAARVGGLQHVRFPDKTLDELVKKLIDTSKIIQAKVIASLDKKGCDSPEAKSAEKALTLFTKVHPGQVYAFIDQEIVKQGGIVTPYDKINAVGNPRE